MTRTTEARDKRRGIPQGSPISPLLANLYMRRFVLGWKMLGLERSLGSRIVTYALLGVAPRTVGILLWWKVGFEDRFQITSSVRAGNVAARSHRVTLPPTLIQRQLESPVV